jgi:ribosomal-protein-alanine N-acetyltransferase
MSTLLAIRSAEIGDLADVVAIETESFSDPWSHDSFQSALELPHFRFLVATDRDANTQVAGYIIIVIVAPEAEIANIAVRSGGRRGGVGRRLVEEGLSLARSAGVETVYLEVRESNSVARRLYETRGFEVVGRRRAYYERPREDALVLRHDFDDA